MALLDLALFRPAWQRTSPHWLGTLLTLGVLRALIRPVLAWLALVTVPVAVRCAVELVRSGDRNAPAAPWCSSS